MASHSLEACLGAENKPPCTDTIDRGVVALDLYDSTRACNKEKLNGPLLLVVVDRVLPSKR